MLEYVYNDVSSFLLGIAFVENPVADCFLLGFVCREPAGQLLILVYILCEACWATTYTWQYFVGSLLGDHLNLAIFVGSLLDTTHTWLYF